MSEFQFQAMPDFLRSKGVADISAKTADEQAALFNEYNAAYKTAVNNFVVGAVKDEAAKAIKAYAESREANTLEQLGLLQKAIEAQGLTIQKMSDKGTTPAEAGDPILKALTENAGNLKALAQSGRAASAGEFTIKAAGSMSLAGNTTGEIPQAFRLPGFNDVPQREIRFLQLFTRGSITSNLVQWVYIANEDGTAGATAEGAAKKQIDFDLLVGEARVEKYSAYIKVTTEMLTDIPMMQMQINTQLSRKLLQSVEVGSFSGSGTTPNLNGVYTVATAWAAGTFALTVDNANLVDVLRVGINQIAVALQPRPNYILLHPNDWTTLSLIKESATDRQYVNLLQQIADTQSLDGVPIIQTTLITAGTFLIGNTGLQYLLEREPVRVDVGLDGNDWTTNFRTILAEWRGVTFVQTNDRTAFVKGTIATCIAALETA